MARLDETIAEEIADEPESDKNKILEDELRNCNKTRCDDGVGVYTYGDGSKWIGEFVDGRPEGQGTCYYSNGDKYIGQFIAGKKHGEGVYERQNG